MNPLLELPMFQQVEKATLDKLWETGKVVRYKRGQHCFQAKEPNQNVYILLHGKVAIYNLTHAGKRKTIFYLGHGELLNDQLSKGEFPAVYCEIIDESQVFTVSIKNFIQLMQSDFSLVRAVLSEYERKMWRMSHQLKNTLGSVYLERKLGSKLWKLARDFGIETERGIYIDIPLSITELADFLGAPRESTSRALKKLVEKELVEVEQKRIYVISPERLSRLYKTGKI